MFACNSLKEKIIIVAEHDEVSAQKIVSMLGDNGFPDVRQVGSGDKVYEIRQREKVADLFALEKIVD